MAEGLNQIGVCHKCPYGTRIPYEERTLRTIVNTPYDCNENEGTIVAGIKSCTILDKLNQKAKV